MKRSSSIERVTLAACALTALFAASCGYHAGLAPRVPEASQSLEDESGDPEGGSEEDSEPRRMGSIGIEIFHNETLLPNIERELHAAMTRSARQHLAVTLRSPQRSDVVVRGWIKDFRRNGGARTGENRLVEASEVVSIEAVMVDRRTGRVLGRTSSRTRVGSAVDVAGRLVAERERALDIAATRALLLLAAGVEYGVRRPGQLLPEEAPAPGSPDPAPRGTSAGAASVGVGAPSGSGAIGVLGTSRD